MPDLPPKPLGNLPIGNKLGSIQPIVDALPTIASAPTSVTLFVGLTPTGPTSTPIPVSSFAAFQLAFGNLNPAYPLTYALWLFFNNGGEQALILSAGNTAPLPSPDPRLATLAAVTIPFNILVIPPDTLNGDLSTPLLNAALALCVKQRAMLILDAPAAWSTRAASGDLTFTPTDLGLTPTASLGNCALYLPRIVIEDPITGTTNITLTAAPAIAAIWAANDARQGVWKSPAGDSASLVGVISLAANLTDAQQTKLNLLGINGLRNLPIVGPIVWGARTLSTDTNFVYINARRLILFLETSIQAGLQWTAFEPDNIHLWAQIVSVTSAFLTTLWRSGALRGDTASQAFFVRCDATIITQQDITQGIVNIIVGVATLEPAEFVIINIQSFAANSATPPHKPIP
jgi:phage tail sheath protein FI